MEPKEREMNFARKNQGTLPGGGTCSQGLLVGREGAPPSNYFLPSPSLEPYGGKGEESGPTPEARKTAHAPLGETAEPRGATPLKVGL